MHNFPFGCKNPSKKCGECGTNPHQNTQRTATQWEICFDFSCLVNRKRERRNIKHSIKLDFYPTEYIFFSSCSLFSSYLIKLPLLVMRISSHKCICEKSTLVCRQIHKLCYSSYANCLRIRTHTYYTCIHELKMLCSPAKQLTHFYLGVNKPISLLFHYFTA